MALVFALTCVTFNAFGDGVQSARQRLDSIQITENTNPEIARLYSELSESVSSLDKLTKKYQDDLRDNLEKMRETEQSLENRLLGSSAMLTVGTGMSDMLGGQAQVDADAAAERDMRAYLETFRCDYGAGRNILGGQKAVQIPTSPELAALVAEYRQIVADLQISKEALGLAPGIEAETVFDSASSGLYDNISTGVQSGAFTSLSRALQNPDGDEAKEWNAHKADAKKRADSGKTTSAVGVAGAVAANMVINKDAPKERSAEIKREYDGEKQKIEGDIKEKQKKLDDAIEENSKKIQEYNDLLELHKAFVKTITDTDCLGQFAEYINDINAREIITDKLQSTDGLEIPWNLAEKQQEYKECVAAAELERARKACLENPKMKWEDNKCVEIPEDESDSPESDADASDPDASDSDPTDDNPEEKDESDSSESDDDTNTDTDTDADEQNKGENCPAVNPSLKSLTDKDKVGDDCTYGNVTRGRVFMYKSGKNAGTCSCTALECKSGFKVSGGRCVSVSGGGSSSPKYCARHELKTKKGAKEYSADGCRSYCKNYAKQKKCAYKEFVSKKSVNPPLCICNPNDKEVKAATACPRYEKPTKPSDKEYSLAGCQAFCNEYAKKNVCQQYLAPLSYKGSNPRCVCNPKKDEREAVVQAQQKASQKYYEVCGGDKGKSGGTEYCVDDVFNWINVNMIQAIKISKEYARVKHGKTIVCHEKHRLSYNDDYVKCATTDNKVFYEFKFDDVKESVDSKIMTNVAKAIGIIHNVPVVTDCTRSKDGICFNTTKSDVCEKMDKVMQKFGYGAHWSGKFCPATLNRKSARKDLNTYGGLDNFAFCKEIQIRGSAQILDTLKQYIRTHSNVPVSNVTCNASYSTYGSGDGCGGNKDDYITCYADGHPIDFVFDDLSESWDTYDEGGRQAMACIVSRGTYTGSKCLVVSKEQCEQVIAANKQGCPECAQAKWNPKTESCELPASASATNLEKGVKVGTMIAGVAAGAVLTVATGGTGAPMLVLVAVETAGGVIEIVAEEKMMAEAEKFLDESNKCRNATCAAQMIKSDMQRMENLISHFTDAEASAVDSELERLIGLLPQNSDIYEYALQAQEEKGFFDPDSWEPEQVWQAVGVAMQLTSLITSLAKSAVTKLPRATAAFKRGVTALDKNLARAERRLAKMTPGTKAYQRQAEKVAKLKKQTGALDDLAKNPDDATAKGVLDDADSKAARQSGKRVTTPTKSAQEIADDGAKLKRYDQLRAKTNPTTSEKQEMQRIWNEWGQPDDETIAAARVIQNNAAKSKELAAAEEELRKYEEWAQKNPGLAKQGQNVRRHQELQDKVRKLGGNVDEGTGGARGVGEGDAARQGARNGDAADDAAR